MADTVDSKTLFSGRRRYIVKFTNISDGTGESAVVKVTKSSLTGPNGSAPSKIVIEEVQWSVQGFSSVRVFWDHTTDDEALVLGAGVGYMNFVAAGGNIDPASSGGTGDIIFTTAGAVSGATYDVTLVLRLKD